MQVELVDNEENFYKLEEIWKNFQSQGLIEDITMTWEWISTWWEVFKDSRDLAILVVKDNDKIVGIAPFIRRKIKYFGMIPYVRLEFIASGEDEKDEICSDYLDIITENSKTRQILESIFRYLHDSANISWDEILLTRLKSESHIVSFIPSLANKFGLNVEEIARVPCIYIRLPNSFDDYLSYLGKNTRYQLKRGIRKLEEKGNISFKIAKTEEEINESKNILINLHQSRWNQKGKPGVFASDKFRMFHDKIMEIAHKKDWLRLGTLYLNQKPVACLYNFLYNNKIYYYQSGMETSSESDIRYGILVHAYAISYAISEGLSEYDFLAGTSDYKRRLAKEQREIVTLRISKRSSKEILYKALCKLKELLKILTRFQLKNIKNDK